MAIKRQASFRLRDKTWEQIDHFSTEWKMTPAQVVEVALEMLTVGRLPGSSAIEMMFRQLEDDVRHLNEHIDKARQIYYDAASDAPPNIAPIPAEPRKRGRKPSAKTSQPEDNVSNSEYGHEHTAAIVVIGREILITDGSDIKYIEVVKDAVHGTMRREVVDASAWGDNPVKVSLRQTHRSNLSATNTIGEEMSAASSSENRKM